jgi:ABC-2 type transport system ATP-binding protein
MRLAARASIPSAGPPRRTIGGVAGDIAVVAERVSKRYPAKRKRLFPPVISIFHRGYFSRSSVGDRKVAPSTTGLLDDVDDLDDMDDDDEFEDEVEEDEVEPQAEEWVWALKDVSFQVEAGQVIGLLGGPRAGKSTLLRIIGGRAFPTEGRVLVRDPVSPPPAAYMVSLLAANRGTFPFSFLLGSQLAGRSRRLAKRHRDEIEEVGRLGLTEEEADKQAVVMLRLALAANAILPAKVILIERLPELGHPFTATVIERLRERLREGAAVVLADRTPGVMAELCDQIVLLDRGTVRSRGPLPGVLANAPNGRGASRSQARPQRAAPSEAAPPRRQPVQTAFHPVAALVSAEVKNETAQRESKRRVVVEHDLLIELRLETSAPGVEVRCGVDFKPRGGREPVRLELPEPARFERPGTYVLSARAEPWTLEPRTVYEVRADASIAHRSEDEPVVLARRAGRVTTVGSEPPADLSRDATTVPHWRGGTALRAESEWSIE